MRTKWLVALLALAGALTSGAALAHSSWYFGFYGWPGYGYYSTPWYNYPPYPYSYPYSYYYNPPAPSHYIERSDPTPPAETWWNYCPESRTYYPYVKECPGGWQQVSPVPPDLKEKGR
jgi:hypothetical protein